MRVRNPRLEELPLLTSSIGEALGYGPSDGCISDHFPLLYKPSNLQRLWAIEGANGGIGAHAGWLLCSLRMEGVHWPVAAIGGVFSSPEVRGQGWASACVEKCLEEAKSAGAVAAFLWTDKGSFYEKWGFQAVGRQWLLRLNSGTKPLLDSYTPTLSSGTLHEWNPKEIPEDFINNSWMWNHSWPFGVERTLQEQGELLRSGAARVFSWKNNSGVHEAYALMNKGKDLRGFVHEWGGLISALPPLLLSLENAVGEYALLCPQLQEAEAPWLFQWERLGMELELMPMAMATILAPKDFSKLVELTLLALGSSFQVSEDGGEFAIHQEGAVLWLGSATELGALALGLSPAPMGPLESAFPLRPWFWGMDSV
jgi:GNAT superfamily N-acetyltransferase